MGSVKVQIGGIAWLMVVGVLLISVHGCKKQTKKESTPQKQTVIFCADWPLPWTEWVFLEYAKSAGFFAKEGLNVIFEKPSLPKESLKMVATGWCDIGYGYQLDLIKMVEEKPEAQLVAVASFFPNTRWGIAFYQSEQLKSAKDFKSAWVAIYNLHTDKILFKAWQKQYNVNADTLFVVDAGMWSESMIQLGNVDAASAWEDSEPLFLEAHANGRKTVFLPLNNTPVYLTVLVANKNFVYEHKELLRKFIRAATKALKSAVENPEKAVSVFLENRSEIKESDYDVWRFVWQQAKAFAAPEANGKIDCNRWVKAIENLNQMGVSMFDLNIAQKTCMQVNGIK